MLTACFWFASLKDRLRTFPGDEQIINQIGSQVKRGRFRPGAPGLALKGPLGYHQGPFNCVHDRVTRTLSKGPLS